MRFWNHKHTSMNLLSGSCTAFFLGSTNVTLSVFLRPRRSRALSMAVKSPWTLVGWVVGASSLCSLASGFAHHHQCITQAAASSASSPAAPRRDRGIALRLAPQKEQQGEGDTATSNASVSEFEKTSDPVKAFVGGLTDLFVLFSGGGNTKAALPPATPKVRRCASCST